MFHNKSDDFLDAVADGRITIVGPPIDCRFTAFRRFGGDGEEIVEPDLAVPAIGYRARLDELTAGLVRLTEFYLGCCHVTYPDLYLVGFARPIIGNIPSISEMQARYVCGLIAGRFARPSNIELLHTADLAERRARYEKLNLDAAYPVEMFSYCDQLARLMQEFPGLRAVGSLRSWIRIQLSPATTMHYLDRHRSVLKGGNKAPIYLPSALIFLLLALKPIDWLYRAFRLFIKRTVREG